MSVRGPRGSRGRGRGSGRGRGRGKTTIWEWETYRPGPEVYDQLWRIRKEPATVTPRLPCDCPIPNARTRILDRRQTETEIQRNFYVVEITHLPLRKTSPSSGIDEKTDENEIVEVDLSRILEYVSPLGLESFENEQFRIEAEAEAEVLRQEAEELARRRLAKNARADGRGKGGRMLSRLGLDPEAPTRGRPRGRGRGRGRGSWRGRGAIATPPRVHDQDTQEELVDAEEPEALRRTDGDIQLIIVDTESEETDSEEEDEGHASPSMMRSAFIANSALPVSPTAPHRRASGLSIVRHGHPEVPDIDDSDAVSTNDDARSMSSAALQLRCEYHLQETTVEETEEESSQGDQHRSKRRRTESTASDQHVTAAKPTSMTRPREKHTQKARPLNRSSVNMSDENGDSTNSSNGSIPTNSHAARYPIHNHGIDMQETATVLGLSNHNTYSTSQQEKLHEEEDSEAEEYVVEDIIEHYYEGGKKYYLVKWEGHDESHDWLPEEDLAGAAELVAVYNERVRQSKQRMR